MNLTKSKTAKFAAGIVGFAMIFSFVVAPATSSAQTVAELQAQIASLLAELQRLQAMVAGGGSTGGSMTGSAPVPPLTIGSQGGEVTKLQNWLISQGFSIPAGATGYFGSQTQAALAAFQAAKSISPAAGYYGPITAGVVASMGGSMPGPGTPPGTVPPALNGSDGSITVSFNPYAAASLSQKKGETKDHISVRLQATSGDVRVSRFDVNYSERPWLLFSSLTLKDHEGNVIATKTLSSAADATEINVGSNYLVRFDNLNYVIRPGNDRILVVSGSALAASDKITGQTVYVGIPSGSIRTINGRGYTDSVGLTSGQGSAPTSGTGNAITLTSTGSTGLIFTRISPSTPPQRIVTTLSGSQTPDVVLGVFSVKSQNQPATINAMRFAINNSTSVATSSLVSNVRLCDGSVCYGATSLSAGADTFTNMTINLGLDVWKDLTLKADILAGVTSVTATSTMLGTGITGVDSNFNTLTLTSASSPTSQAITFLSSGIAVTNTSTTFSPIISNNATIGGTVTFQFTVTNTGNNDVFLSGVPASALSTSTSGSVGSPASGSSTITAITTSPGVGQFAADTATITSPQSGAYVIPAGNSRVFTFTGTLNNKNGTEGLRVFRITAVNFGTSAASPTGNSVTFGIENLVVQTSLAAS